ncbi:hypothetical protein BDV06DRAFT_198220 [Aspergillus oleicola]
MDSDYPPLPSSRAVDPSPQNLSLSDGETTTQASSGSGTPLFVTSRNGQDSPNIQTQIIVEIGDLVLEYTSSKHASIDSRTTAIHRWRVSSDALRENSSYFRALLDPDKFSEGRDFMRQRQLHTSSLNASPAANGDVTGPSDHSPEPKGFPTLRLPENHLSQRLGPEIVGLFLRVLCFDSFSQEVKESFDVEVKNQRPSFIAGVIELADAFNSPQVVRDTLKRSRYTLGKPKLPLTKFTSSMLKLNEERVRQSIYIAKFLNDRTVLQMLTHTLIVAGSRFWVNGIESLEPGALPWHYLPGGLEEELYYRRQSVLNTITDLQAHFLRIYGALEEPTTPKAGALPNPPSAATRQFQCRCALGNSSACDTFHLGQMTRFFSLRTKTIFIGSTLIDPDFNPDTSDAEAEPQHQTERPADITSIISLLKQCPDYQIDSNHTACGIRRRFLPSMDLIEGFVGDERGLLGLNLSRWRGEGNRGGAGSTWPHIQGSWANRSHRRALVMDLRLSRISGIPSMSPGSPAGEFREEDARLLFTAKKRNWEA